MAPAPVFVPGSTALITGGASGIGLAIAKTCRNKGMSTLLVDIDDEALKSAKQLNFPDDPNVVTAKVDVSNSTEWQGLKDLAVDKFGSVELLVLNAGRGMKGGWGDEDYFRSVSCCAPRQRQKRANGPAKTLETNLFGVINGINTFLPLVQQAALSKPTSIIITGSKQGITNPPGNPAYNASKAAVKTLAEHLSWDLRDTNTSVHLLVPGWTHTGLVSSAVWI